MDGKQTKLIIMICLSSLFFFAEIVGGYVYGSVALVADSFHMLSDIFSFIIALYATRVTIIKLDFKNSSHSHGHSHCHGHSHTTHSHDDEITDEHSLHDVEHGHEPCSHNHSKKTTLNGFEYQAVADSEEDPLELNTAVVKAAELMKDHHGDLNLHGVYLHLFGDLMTSIGVITSTLIIIYIQQDWTIYMDPIMSLLITVIIIISTIPLCRSAIFILLQATPQSISLTTLKNKLMKINGILNIHELHVWQLSDTQIVGSVHVVLAKTNPGYMEIADLIKMEMH
ncbi:hypothetical protein HDV01_001624, partial [Terramyces sp. JEL0728]